jgi:hypothetical protein
MPIGVEMTEEKKAEEKLEDESEKLESETEPTVEELKAQIVEKNKHIKSLNNESAERRKKLEAFEKAEVDRKTAELSAIERVEKIAEGMKAEKAKLEQENKLLKLQGSFGVEVRKLKLEFVNEVAAQDAFKALDIELVGDDLSGMEEAIKSLAKERSYLFGKSEQAQQTNDGARRSKGNTQDALNADAIAKKRSQYAPL